LHDLGARHGLSGKSMRSDGAIDHLDTVPAHDDISILVIDCPI